MTRQESIFLNSQIINKYRNTLCCRDEKLMSHFITFLRFLHRIYVSTKILIMIEKASHLWHLCPIPDAAVLFVLYFSSCLLKQKLNFDWLIFRRKTLKVCKLMQIKVVSTQGSPWPSRPPRPTPLFAYLCIFDC